MSKIHFKPWVGDNYQGSTGVFEKRILILGESHYQWDETKDPSLPSNVTIECVEEQILGEETHRFWTVIANVFLGEEGWRSPEDKKEFWHSVAFANYVQESVGFGARERPTEDMWERARTAFPELLAKTQPQLIAVMGYELWTRLPGFDHHDGPDITGLSDERSKETGFYQHSKGKAMAFRMAHPSWGKFSYADWAPGLMDAIEKAPVN